MKGITVADKSPDDSRFLSFDLLDLLLLLGTEGQDAEWIVAGVECLGPGSDELYRLVSNETHISGRHLFEVAKGITQVIDGSFAAYRDGEPVPWLVIRAVDSSAYDIESDDEDVLARIREHFKEVVNIP
jgi:hypothetical protein